VSVTHSSERIGPADRVSDVLARDESLVDVFVRHSPHFEKLRNRGLRRVMAALVTVEQAARVAGVGVDVLLRDLNGALAGDAAAEAHGTEGRSTDGVSTVPAAAKRPAELPEIELDLREDMRAGREPFSRIMAAVHALGDHRALRLRTIFEPVPLFAVLARRGFVYESRQHAPDDWSVWFWRGASRPESAVHDGSATARPGDANDAGDERTHTLDVRGLQPPEPMMRTLAALETLPEGHELVQINVRVPQLLLPMLAERGFACAVDESRPDRVLVRIWRPTGG
jgi:uncharacterized protein (DUF2249 family)